jgi:alpha 1,2-mannosyltransferase
MSCLLVCCVFRFQQVLLLDCDVILAKDPTFMFDSPGFVKHGNWFWGDVWGTGLIKDKVFSYVGLDIEAKAALWEGKYDFKRYAESGQIMIDKARHLGEWDVIQPHSTGVLCHLSPYTLA